MTRRTISLLLTCLLATSVGLAGCAGSKKQETPEEAKKAEKGVKQATKPAFDARAALEDAASWLPADTFAVATAEGYQSARWFEQLMPTREDVEPGDPGTVEALETDLRELYRGRVGLDVVSVEGMVVGVGRSWQALVLFGDIDATDAVKRSEVRGHTALRIPVDFPREIRQFVGKEVWALQLQEPRPGVAVFRDRRALERAIEAEAAEPAESKESATTLAGSELKNFGTLYEQVDTRKLAGAVLLEELGMLQQMSGRLPVPLPDRIVLGVGDTIGLSAAAPQETLDEIKDWLDRQSRQLRRMVDTFDDNLESRSTGQAASMIAAYHMGKAYLRVLEPTHTDGRLTYSVEMPGGQMTIVTVGVLAAIAIPAFTKYIKRSKTAETEFQLRKLADGAKMYFMSEQTGCKGMSAEKCGHPWHDDAQAGMPIPFEDYVFPGGTNVKLVSTPQTPSGGNKYTPEPTLLEGPDGVTVDSILQRFNLRMQDPMYFKYVYETGPGSGNDATATLRAIHDFDPASPAKHTVRQKLRVEDGEVQVTPPVVLNEFQ